jgi:hypothetical protein
MSPFKPIKLESKLNNDSASKFSVNSKMLQRLKESIERSAQFRSPGTEQKQNIAKFSAAFMSNQSDAKKLQMLNLKNADMDSLQAILNQTISKLKRQKPSRLAPLVSRAQQSHERAVGTDSALDRFEDDEEELELDIESLTQEDKFFLLQQIEDIQSNIRYNAGSERRETYVFHDFEDDEEQPISPKMAADKISPRSIQSQPEQKGGRMQAKSTLHVDESLEII